MSGHFLGPITLVVALPATNLPLCNSVSKLDFLKTLPSHKVGEETAVVACLLLIEMSKAVLTKM